MGRVLLYVVVIALTIFALIDCIQTDDERVRGIPKIGWILLIVLIWIVGPVAWLLAGKERGQRLGYAGGIPGAPRHTGPARRPVAPDDDPEFLRQISAGNAEHERMLKKWEEDLKRREQEMRTEDESDGEAPGKS
jgi:hypothetical protein